MLNQFKTIAFHKIEKDVIQEYKERKRSEGELDECRRIRLEALLEKAGVEANLDGDRIPSYEEALSVSKGGFTITYKRDISEIYVNTYNK